MGRYYKTAGANPLDYMYRLNTPLMEKVVQANDQFIDQNLAGLSKLDQLANYNHLIGDDEDAKNITAGYRKRVEEITKAIQEDPANWRKHIDPIRSVSKDLQTDYESGTISKQMYNYNQRKTAFDAVDKQVELYHTSGGTKGVSPERAMAYKNHWDSKFNKTGYDANTGAYNVYKAGSVMDNIDIKKALADGLDKIKADKTNQYHEDVAGNGWYFNKETQKIEQITPEKILSVASDNVNQNILNYLKQDQQVGLIKGVYDDNGKFVSPYGYNKIEISPEEQAKIDSFQKTINGIKNPSTKAEMQKKLDAEVAGLKNRSQLQWNNQSYLAPILRGLVNTYSYKNIEQGNDLSNNSYGSTHYTQEQTNNRHAATLAQQKTLADQREAGLNQRAADRLAFDKYKWDNPHETKTGTKSGTKSATGKKEDKKEEATPTETTISRVANNSFEDWPTTDIVTNKTVPVLSVAGLSSDIVVKKQQLAGTEKRIKDIDAAILKGGLNAATIAAYKVEKAKLQESKEVLASDLNSRRSWYKASTEAVLNGSSKSGVTVTPSDAALYKEFDGDRDGTKIKAKADSAYNELVRVNNINPHDEAWAKYPNDEKQRGAYMQQLIDKKASDSKRLKQEWQGLIDKRNNYLSLKKRVDKGRDNWLTELRKDVIDTDAIQLGTKDAKDVGSILMSNTTGYKIFDASGKSTDGTELEGSGISWFNPKADNSNMTFANGSLKDYIDKNNVSVNVKKIANTTKIGSGNAVAEVTFDDPKGEIPKGKVFYIEMTPEVQKDVANRLKATTKNPEVGNIIGMLTDDEGNNIRKQLMKPSVNRVTGTDGEEEGSYTIMVNNLNGDKVPLRVTRFTDGTSTHLQVANENGVPFPSDNSQQGFFNGIEDFVQQYKKQKQIALQQSQKK